MVRILRLYIFLLKNMTTIGIDQSINSTGICVCEDGDNIYYNIVSKMTRTLKNFSKAPTFNLNIISYEKSEPGDNYTSKEVAKTKNIYNIVHIIENIIKYHTPDKLILEGVSYASNGSVVDLAGLNYAIRMIAMKYNIEIIVIPPTTLKKSAISNGQATKDMMIDAWKRIENIGDVPIKIDDLADAYFLAHFEK